MAKIGAGINLLILWYLFKTIYLRCLNFGGGRHLNIGLDIVVEWHFCFASRSRCRSVNFTLLMCLSMNVPRYPLFSRRCLKRVML